MSPSGRALSLARACGRPIQVRSAGNRVRSPVASSWNSASFVECPANG
jgi:hypothetical protein